MAEQKRRTKTGREAKYSRAEGLALVERWRASGLSSREFCQTHGVRLNRLHYWAHAAGLNPTPKPNPSAQTGTQSEFFVVTRPAEAPGTSPRHAKAVIVIVPCDVLGQSLRGVLEELGI